MAIKTKETRPSAETIKAMRALQIIEERVAFGPLFFMRVLRGFVRERCPEPSEGIPTVLVRLGDGQTLALCHIIGISPNWLALAVHDEDHPDRREPLRTEIVPYQSIARITIETARHDGPIGFNVGLAPEVFDGDGTPGLTPEQALAAVATLPKSTNVATHELLPAAPKPPRKRAKVSAGSRPAARRPRRRSRTK